MHKLLCVWRVNGTVMRGLNSRFGFFIVCFQGVRPLFLLGTF